MRKLLLCDCAGTQKLDAQAIEDACGVTCSKVATALCTQQLDQVEAALSDGDVMIACQQERALFEELAGDLGVNTPAFVDVRDRAGWSDSADAATAKMAALVAEALLPATPVPTVDVVSEGTCLIVGAGDIAFPLAEQLASALAVTVLDTAQSEVPMTRAFDVIRGQLRTITGAFGGFELKLDQLQQVQPGGRGAFGMTNPKDGARSTCDILIDLTGDRALVSAPDKREGYLRADPKDQLAIGKVAATAVQMVGTFEKPLYVSLTEAICAHSRAGQAGCSNCLDVCPTGAIRSAGDHVAIDPMICAGCGSCSALCPSGAIQYADPPVSEIVRRLDTLSKTYRGIAGSSPRLLVHDGFGAEMIQLSARFDDGLPADVIPLELPVVSGFGHAEILAAFAQGFAAVDILIGPKTETDALMREVELARAIASDAPIRLLDLTDPSDLSKTLRTGDAAAPVTNPILPLGDRRQITRMAARALHAQTDVPVVLPDGAPYGAVLVNTDSCTLCLACASLCPSGALVDNPDRPELRFQEDACLQCGLCAQICPEDAITYEPRLNLADSALSQTVLNEEDPFACIECGAEFGVKSTVERILGKLSGVHSMFMQSDQARLIQMCDDCRVRAQYHSENNPFSAEPRPKTRTTEDYYSDRKDH